MTESHNITEARCSFLHHVHVVFWVLNIGAINCNRTNFIITFLGIFMIGQFGLWWWAGCLFAGGMCESTHTDNQGDHQTTAEMRRVHLFLYLANNVRLQRNTGTQATLGSVHPSTQQGWSQGCCLPQYNKKLCTSRVYHKAVLLWSHSPSQQEALACLWDCVISTQEFYSKQAENEWLRYDLGMT